MYPMLVLWRNKISWGKKTFWSFRCFHVTGALFQSQESTLPWTRHHLTCQQWDLPIPRFWSWIGCSSHFLHFLDCNTLEFCTSCSSVVALGGGGGGIAVLMGSPVLSCYYKQEMCPVVSMSFSLLLCSKWQPEWEEWVSPYRSALP